MCPQDSQLAAITDFSLVSPHRPARFSSIKEVDQNSGAILRNPCRDEAWDELQKAHIVERHQISGVTGGGLHIVDDQDVRHEVRNFLDNAAVGPWLTRVLGEILQRIQGGGINFAPRGANWSNPATSRHIPIRKS
jgi:hypothetical protein